jgi:hypothetical protein
VGTPRRAGRAAIFVIAIATAIAGCSGAHSEHAVTGPTTIAPSATIDATRTPPTGRAPATTPAKCIQIARPRAFPFPTFLESGNGEADVVRAGDGAVVQVLAPPCPRSSGLGRILVRAPNGHVLAEIGRRGDDPADEKWTDLETGVSYPGGDATVSPDGTRVATDRYGKHGWSIIRQYDAATGRVLSSIDLGTPPGAFDWSADSAALVVALAPADPGGGLYVIPRDAHALPDHPTVPNPAPDAYTDPAVLANGHVVAFEYPYPDQHDSWPTALVDIDLRSGVVRTVAGSTSFDPKGVPSCRALAVGAAVPAMPDQCVLTDPYSIDANGDAALFVVFDAPGVWLYDGSSIHHVSDDPSSYSAHW